MRKIATFALLAACSLAKHQSHNTTQTAVAPQEDKASQIIDDISKGVDVAQKIKDLLKGFSGTNSGSNTGNQEFDFVQVDDQLNHKNHGKKQHKKHGKKHHKKHGGSPISIKIGGGHGNHGGHGGHGNKGGQGNEEFDFVEVDDQLNHKKHHKKHHKKAGSPKMGGGSGSGSGSQGNQGGQGNEEFDFVEVNDELSHKKHHKKQNKTDKFSKIVGDISKGADVAKQIEKLFGHHSGSKSSSQGGSQGSQPSQGSQGGQGNEEFDFVEVNDQLNHKKHGKKHHKKHGGSPISIKIGGGSGSGSGNQEFDLVAVDDQFDKASDIIGDISKGVDVAQKIADLFKKQKSSQKGSSGSTGSSGQGNQEMLF